MTGSLGARIDGGGANCGQAMGSFGRIALKQRRLSDEPNNLIMQI